MQYLAYLIKFVFPSLYKLLFEKYFCYFSVLLRSYEWMSSGAHAPDPFKFINKASTQRITWHVSVVCYVDSETKDSAKAVDLPSPACIDLNIRHDLEWF